MTEIYVITSGYGELELGTPEPYGSCHSVAAGSVFEIPVGVPHMLRNKCAGHLEHLVFAVPPFNPSDVYLLEEKRLFEAMYPHSLFLPEPQLCFDGAKILPYTFPHLGLSIAFGWVTNDRQRRAHLHYHQKTTEWVYVIGGTGDLVIGGVPEPIQPGDWIRIDPTTEHGLLNEAPEDLVVVCICSPPFQMEDVYYRQ